MRGNDNPNSQSYVPKSPKTHLNEQIKFILNLTPLNLTETPNKRYLYATFSIWPYFHTFTYITAL